MKKKNKQILTVMAIFLGLIFLAFIGSQFFSLFAQGKTTYTTITLSPDYQVLTYSGSGGDNLEAVHVF